MLIPQIMIIPPNDTFIYRWESKNKQNTMNKQEALEKIEELKKFIEKEDNVDEYDPNWRAAFGGEYWYVNEYGNLCNAVEEREVIDRCRHALGNYFKTMEIGTEVGLKEDEKTKAIMRVKRYIYNNFGEFNVKKAIINKEKKETCWYNGRDDQFNVEMYDSHVEDARLIGCVACGNMIKVIEACEDDLRIIFDVEPVDYPM